MSFPETTQIVSGPIPDEYGNACFVVQVGDRSVDAFASADGCAVREADFDVGSQVMNAVSNFRRHAPEKVLSCLCEAATLRRRAGHPTELEVPIPDSMHVRPDPDVRDRGVRFTVDVGPSSVGVLVTGDGAIIDCYDLLHHPTGEVQPEGLLAARRAVLDFVLAHPGHASAWGIDCQLLDLLWN